MSRNTQHPDYSTVEINVAFNVTVVFAKVEADSKLDDRVRELKTNVEAFSGFLEDGLSSDDLKRQANFVNAAFSGLADVIEKEQRGRSTAEAVATVVKTAAAIMERYSTAREAQPDFGKGPSERLARRTHELYRNTAGRFVDEQFMWNLKFYDWASRRNLLPEPHRYERRYGREARPQTFTDEELAAFFKDNENRVLEKLVRMAQNNIDLVDPLADPDNVNGYRAFRGLALLSDQDRHSNSHHDD